MQSVHAVEYTVEKGSTVKRVGDKFMPVEKRRITTGANLIKGNMRNDIEAAAAETLAQGM